MIRLPGPCRGVAARGQEVVPTLLTLVTCMMEPVPTVFVEAEWRPWSGAMELQGVLA